MNKEIVRRVAARTAEFDKIFQFPCWHAAPKGEQIEDEDRSRSGDARGNLSLMGTTDRQRVLEENLAGSRLQ